MNTLRRNSGFTLIETLVAFVIAATSLALLYRIHASATTTSILAQEYVAATELGQSLTSELAITERSLSFSKAGERHQKYHWTARADLYTDRAAEQNDRPQPYALRTVSVEVTWLSRGKQRRVDLETIRPFMREREP